MATPKQPKKHNAEKSGFPQTSHPLALYIHIPFCETKCPYCDFNTFAGIESMMPEYIDALVQEIWLWGETLSAVMDRPGIPLPINSVFFGGGTPSYIPFGDIQRLMDTVRSSFALDSNSEVTMESNPGDITIDRLKAYKDTGVNRLSIGVQSLDDNLLKLLGRRHNGKEAQRAYHMAREAGFDNVNLDLMYGLPTQTMSQWKDTMSKTLTLHPEHLSIYCLTLEEGTPMEAGVRQGVLPDPDPDLAADMYLLAEDLTSTVGYHQYEISNWSLPGHKCHHNLTYWNNQAYLGVGPGAHSCLNGYRFANLRSPRHYISRIQAWSQCLTRLSDIPWIYRSGTVDMVETMSLSMEMADTMILGLRLNQGVSEIDFRSRFGAGITETYGVAVEESEQLGLLAWHNGWLKLTPRGRLLGNEVFQMFLVETN